MNRVVFRGQAGEVKWAYHNAAALSAWELHADPTGGRLTATIVSQHAFRMTQPSLTFVVPRPNGQWRWPITSLQIAGDSLTATLGPQES